MRVKTAALLLTSALLACGVEGHEVYDVTGTLLEIEPGARVVRIAHDDIPGFMQAMTMSFDVASPELVKDVALGSKVRFELERTGSNLMILTLEVTGPPDARFVPIEREPPPEKAPDFELVDQSGAPFRLSSQQGKAVLLDFIFTQCPGPCPILTAAHARLQRMLPPEVARRTHFVSVSLDPANDTPEAMLEYATKRGANLESWSFVTGETDAVQAVIDAYHVGTIRTPDGEIDHLVITFLISPDGDIKHRYPGLNTPERQIIDDLRALLA